MRYGERKFIWVGHYGCSRASKLVRVRLGTERTLRPHWMDKWHVPNCPACRERHDAVQPMWRRGAYHEWKTAHLLRHENKVNPVKVTKKAGTHKGAYLA